VLTQKPAEWELQCDPWDGDVRAGPDPKYFADTLDIGLSPLKEDMGKAHYGLNRLHRIFFEEEHGDVIEAIDLEKNPR